MSLGGYMAYTLYIGAAFADANGDQTRLLRTKLPPMLKRMRELQGDDHNWPLAAKSLLMRIQEVMGPKWRPSDPWMAQIKALLADQQAPGKVS